MSTPGTAPQPYATLLAFTRYVNRSGPAKASFVGGLRRQRESGSGFNPHAQFVKALKADIQFRTDGTYLAHAVRAVNPRYHRLYTALADGATRYLASLNAPEAIRPTLLQVHEAIGMIGGLPVKVAAHFGLFYEPGRVECVRLHFDEEPPTPETVTATLHLMTTHMDQILPNADPVLLDLRRAELHRAAELPRDASAVDRWLTGEAAGFAAMWRAA